MNSDRKPRRNAKGQFTVEYTAPEAHTAPAQRDELDPTQPPNTPDQLHALLRTHFNITIPRTALLDNSRAPFDYLIHTFFEGRFTNLTENESPPDQPTTPPDCVVWASRGGGKTFLGAIATLLDLVYKPGIEIRILGGSLEQSQRMAEHLRRLLGTPCVQPLVKRITTGHITMTHGSRAAVLTHSQRSIRGTRVQKLRCDEVELFDEDVWQAAQLTTRAMKLEGPWGSTVRGSVEAFSTMHRPMGLMWKVVSEAQSATMQLNLSESNPSAPASASSASSPCDTVRLRINNPLLDPERPSPRLLFRWGVVDVLEHCTEPACDPTCALGAECGGRAKRRTQDEAGHYRVIDALNQKARVNGAAWEAEMLALRPSRGGTVLPEFRIEHHVYGSLHDTIDIDFKPGRIVLAGMDFGFRAPTVILWATLDHGNVLRIHREYVMAERTIDEHLQQFGTAPKPAWIGVDPAGAQRNDQTGTSNVALLKKAGLVVRHRGSGIYEGVQFVRLRLERTPTRSADDGPVTLDTIAPPSSGPGLLIHARCRKLIEAMQRYHYPEDQPESLNPVKDGHDHLIDALRYLILNLDARRDTRLGKYN